MPAFSPISDLRISRPGGGGWSYTVASATMASQKQSSGQRLVFLSTLVVAMVLLWPHVSALKKDLDPAVHAAAFAIGALRTGLICGALLGLEMLLIYDLKDLAIKAPLFAVLMT